MAGSWVERREEDVSRGKLYKLLRTHGLEEYTKDVEVYMRETLKVCVHCSCP